MPGPGTLGEVLAERRRARVVGREGEIELFRAAMVDDDPPWSVLHVHGPGGIGKTTLLDAFARIAQEAGATVLRVDAGAVVPRPDALAAALRPHVDLERSTGHPDAEGPGPERRRPLVLLVDAYERLTALDDWVRTRLVPALPGTARVVLAGRRPPGSAWRADASWGALLRVVSLRNLSQAATAEFLRRCGIDVAMHARITATTYGHPLALALVAGLIERGGDLPDEPLQPDLVADLLGRLVDEVPDDACRHALEAGAMARVATEDTIRAAVGDAAARDAFAWLRAQPYAEATDDGVALHELVRDLVDRDLRWRDPSGYAEVFRAVRDHVGERVRRTTGLTQQRAILDLKFAFRNLASVLGPVDWESWGERLPEPAEPADHAAVCALVARAEGDESARLARHWLDVQPQAFEVLRDADGLTGVVALLDLTAAGADAVAVDPGTRSAWDHAAATAAPREEESVTMTRFVVDRDGYQAPSQTLNAVPVLTLQRYLRTPRLAWDYLALAEPEAWDAYFALVDLPRRPGADFVVGGRRYGIFAHDFRERPVDGLLELWTERGLGMEARNPPPRPSVLVLSRDDFAAAVREALHHLHRPDLLGRNPLARSRVAIDHSGRDHVGLNHAETPDLRGLLEDAVAALGADPRADKAYRAVVATYLRRTTTQEAAAARLGMPFSTYRRHLALGMGRVTDWLWERELHGS
jgi:hypothetical protein